MASKQDRYKDVNLPESKISPEPSEDKEAEDVEIRPEPHALLQAVSGLAARRNALAKSQDEAKLAKLQALEPTLQKVFHDTWDSIRRSEREAMREAHAEERNRGLQEFFKQVRIQPRPLEELSNEELQGEIDHAIEEERKRGNFDLLPGETEDQWWTRVGALYDKVEYLGYLLYLRQRSSKVRYVDGFPSNVLAVHPKFMPPSRFEYSRVGKCLQCRAKRMRCSRTIRVKYIDPSIEECTRCRRSGESCIVKRRADDVDAPSSYAYALPGRRADQSEAASAEFNKLSDKLWAMRYRDGRISPMPLWHQNDRAGLRKDENFKPRTWQDELTGQPATWIFSQDKLRRAKGIHKVPNLKAE